MKVIVLLCLLLLPLKLSAQNPASPPEILDPPTEFDEWTSLPFPDEKARLDNLAIHWQQSPRMRIHVVIYAGKKACVGEAKTRWAGVREWLVRKRGVPADKITWVDGGYREEATITVWLWPPELGKPPEAYNSLERGQVKVIKGCRVYADRSR